MLDDLTAVIEELNEVSNSRWVHISKEEHNKLKELAGETAVGDLIATIDRLSGHERMVLKKEDYQKLKDAINKSTSKGGE